MGTRFLSRVLKFWYAYETHVLCIFLYTPPGWFFTTHSCLGLFRVIQVSIIPTVKVVDKYKAPVRGLYVLHDVLFCKVKIMIRMILQVHLLDLLESYRFCVALAQSVFGDFRKFVEGRSEQFFEYAYLLNI